MSVQNGERLATKQDLADMYSGLLPFLGGMPEVLANKFSKGDLYDTSEKMIGKWINGKPLYFRTINVASDIQSVIENLLSTFNIEYIVDLRVMMANNYIAFISTDLKYNETTKKCSTSLSGWCRFIILAYTKTTDSANSFNIGESTDYSTDEKIIGTWLNGEPLYQKTIDCGALPNNTTKTISTGITNIDKIVSMSGVAISSATVLNIPHVTTGDAKYAIEVYTGQGNVYIATKYDYSSSYASSYITLQYTKTNS